MAGNRDWSVGRIGRYVSFRVVRSLDEGIVSLGYSELILPQYRLSDRDALPV